MSFLKRIFNKKNRLNKNMGKNKNQGKELIDLVFSLYEYRIKREHLIKPKVFKNTIVKGKNNEYKIDIYIEFIQMNNIERTIIKTVDRKIVKAEDILQFDNILNDLNYFPKGILYYNDEIDEKALNIAKNKHIEIIYFDVMQETRKNGIETLNQFLPNKDVIGDPFWTLMQVDERTKNNKGNYIIIKDSLPLFTSKKLADAFCEHQKGYAVFGISQYHLESLLYLVEHGLLRYKLGVIQPSKQKSSRIDYNVKMFNVEYYIIREIYVR